MRLHLSIIAALILLPLSTLAQDLIMTKWGEDINCKILGILPDGVLFESNVTDIRKCERNALLGTMTKTIGDGTEFGMNKDFIYMIQSKKRGNVFFGYNGMMRTEQPAKTSRGASFIYLTTGKEIVAYDIKISQFYILYKVSPEKKQAFSVYERVKSEDVFKIRYSDGSQDILFPLLTQEEAARSLSINESESAQEESYDNPEETERELKVVFHKVKPGESLASIADRYDVSPEDIINWNELPAGTNIMISQPVGSELMIYVEANQ